MHISILLPTVHHIFSLELKLFHSMRCTAQRFHAYFSLDNESEMAHESRYLHWKFAEFQSPFTFRNRFNMFISPAINPAVDRIKLFQIFSFRCCRSSTEKMSLIWKWFLFRLLRLPFISLLNVIIIIIGTKKLDA